MFGRYPEGGLLARANFHTLLEQPFGLDPFADVTNDAQEIGADSEP